MRVLLDTNVFLWCAAGVRSKLSSRAARIVEDPDNELLLSAASLWEIALKVRAGKIELPESTEFFREQLAALGMGPVLPVQAHHVFALFGLPDHHKDPFDRLLVAQCRAEKLPLITSDRLLRAYPVEILW